jgi:hypothetical protein
MQEVSSAYDVAAAGQKTGSDTSAKESPAAETPRFQDWRVPVSRRLQLASDAQDGQAGQGKQTALEKPQAPRAADAPQQPARTPLDDARDHLKQVIDSSGLRQKDVDRFHKNMTDFDSRAQQQGMSANEITDTYANLSKMIEFQGQASLDRDARLKVAQHAMKNAAHPTSIDQGMHDTCNVTAVEARVYARNPSAATKLLNEVATTGGFTSADGTKIIINPNSLKPDDESRQNPTGDRYRSYAGQLFQIAAVNTYWQRQDHDPFGNYATKGSIRFEQDNRHRGFFGADTGERLLAYWSNPPKELAKGPSLSASALQDIADQISGLNETGFVIENSVHGGKDTIHVASEKELRDVLTKMNQQQPSPFPVIIRVHTGNEPFLSDQGGSSSRSRGVWHVVSITSFDEKTDKVSVDNQWGSSADHVMKLKDLYTATEEPKTSTWRLFHEFSLGIIPKKPQPVLPPEDPMWIH